MTLHLNRLFDLAETIIQGRNCTLLISRFNIATLIDNTTGMIAARWEADDRTAEWFIETYC